MRDERTNEQLKIELLSQWKLEVESRKNSVLMRFSDFSVRGNCIKRANDMKQNNLILQLYCNFTLVKLNTFKTHMKKRKCFLALGKHRNIFLGQLYRGSLQHETKAI